MNGKHLQGNVAIVTGASRGIGYAAALELAKAGAHIIALARTVGGLEELDDDIKRQGGTATLVPLDMTDFDALDRLGQTLHQRYGKLDILVGNAAVLGGLSPLGHYDPQIWDKVMATNLTANWRLIRSLDPLLRQSKAGRAVFVTSGITRTCSAFWGAYCVSKTGLEALIRIWADETRNLMNLKVNLFNPGAVRTHMRAQAMPGEDPESLIPPTDVAPYIVNMCLPSFMHTGMTYDFPRRLLLGFAPLDLRPVNAKA